MTEETASIIAHRVSILMSWFRDGRTGEHIMKIVSCIRSCDAMSESLTYRAEELILLKSLTTARIRSIIGLSGNRGLDVNDMPLTELLIKERDGLLGLAPYHFRVHYHSCVRTIQEVYGYDLLNEKRIGGVICKQSK